MSEQGSRFQGQSRVRARGMLWYGRPLHGVLGWRCEAGMRGMQGGAMVWCYGMLASVCHGGRVTTPGDACLSHQSTRNSGFCAKSLELRWQSWVKGVNPPLSVSPRSRRPDCQVFNSPRGQKGGGGQVSDITPAPSLGGEVGGTMGNPVT